MRIRSKESPPTQEDIDRILHAGASAPDKKCFPNFLRRLQQAFFIDAKCRPVPVRKRLIAQYKSDGLVLIVGAGVSSDSGVPSWPKLAEVVLVKAGIKPLELKTIKKALQPNITQFELAGWLLETRRALVKAIYEGLYDRMECKPLLEKIPKKYEDQIRWQGWGGVLKALRANRTLGAVGDLLTAKGAKPRRNPQIHAVLTFNADNLLELYCAARTNGRRIVTMVDRASVGAHPDEIPVYHLHGTLDARGENVLRGAVTSEFQEITDELVPDLVFRESEYYETIAHPASFVNHTPQSFLRSLNALFIGTSLDDLNMRRWLHDSFRERVLHRTKYLKEFYWKPYTAAEYEAKLESRRHFWLRSETEKAKGGRTWTVPKKHVQRIMSNLGIQVVWCTNYNAISRYINKVRHHGYSPKFGRGIAVYPR
jgi:hypothetical protein